MDALNVLWKETTSSFDTESKRRCSIGAPSEWRWAMCNIHPPFPRLQSSTMEPKIHKFGHLEKGSRLWSPVYHTKKLVVVDDRAVNAMSPAFFDIKFDNSLYKIHVVLAGPVLSMFLDDTIWQSFLVRSPSLYSLGFYIIATYSKYKNIVYQYNLKTVVGSTPDSTPVYSLLLAHVRWGLPVFPILRRLEAASFRSRPKIVHPKPRPGSAAAVAAVNAEKRAPWQQNSESPKKLTQKRIPLFTSTVYFLFKRFPILSHRCPAPPCTYTSDAVRVLQHKCIQMHYSYIYI